VEKDLINWEFSRRRAGLLLRSFSWCAPAKQGGQIAMELFWTVVLIQAFVFGGFSSFIAKEKNRDSAGWLFLGFLFSLIALLALIAVPKLEKKAQAQSQSPPLPPLPPSPPIPTKTKIIRIVLILVGMLLLFAAGIMFKH
jgi:drug/metabolite transporter (DMT)-like permease